MGRALSVSAAIMGLVVASPVMLAMAIGVRMSMGKPVLFRQMRSGLDGRAFQMLKFRTMRAASDENGNPLPDGDRITPLGKFLRRTRLDELPELLNIIRGDMAWIGPRPLLPETIDEMGAAGRRRGQIRPGLTGWAQVNGNSLLTPSQKLALDLWYVDNRTAFSDPLIFLMTARVILAGEQINHRALEKCDAYHPCRSR